MVTGDRVCKQVSEKVFGGGMLRSGGGVIQLAGDFGLVRIGLRCEVGLPLGSELSEIMPKPGEIAPLASGVAVRSGRKHVRGEFSGPPSDFVEVAMVGIEGFTGLAMSSAEGGAIFAEKWFPWLPRRGGVGVWGRGFHNGCEFWLLKASWLLGQVRRRVRVQVVLRTGEGILSES